MPQTVGMDRRRVQPNACCPDAGRPPHPTHAVSSTVGSEETRRVPGCRGTGGPMPFCAPLMAGLATKGMLSNTGSVDPAKR
jgi:hypothetical protein